MKELDAIVDVNVTLGQWPTRRVSQDKLEELSTKLREHQVEEAWAGHFDGLFQDDLRGVNNRLIDACRSVKSPRLLPFAAINPAQEDWHDELRRCSEYHRVAGIRLHPNYHGYALSHPNFVPMLKAAAKLGMVVQIAALMEDERMMHPLMRVRNVDLAPLSAVLPQIPGLRLVLLNASKTLPNDLLAAPDVYCDIAMLEGVGGLERLLTDVPVERVLFGSHSPSLYFESSALKLKESALPVPHLSAISHRNARDLLQRA